MTYNVFCGMLIVTQSKSVLAGQPLAMYSHTIIIIIIVICSFIIDVVIRNFRIHIFMIVYCYGYI